MEESLATPRQGAMESQPLVDEETVSTRHISDATYSFSDDDDSSGEQVVVVKYRKQIILAGLVALMGSAAIVLSQTSQQAKNVSQPTPTAATAPLGTTPIAARLFEYHTPCNTYRGMFNPSGTACCPKGCATNCDGPQCSLGYGGAAQCCSKNFQETCAPGVKAPCRLSFDEKFVAKIEQCGSYNGIDHPLGSKCCAATCGALCGAEDCTLGYGGAAACCRNNVNLPDCLPGVQAPCQLILLKKTFSGLLVLTSDDDEALLSQEGQVRKAAEDVLMLVFGLPTDMVQVKGLPLRWPADSEPKPAIDYELHLPGDSPLTPADILSKPACIPYGFNRALALRGVKVKITKVELTYPALNGPPEGKIVKTELSSPQADATCASQAPAVIQAALNQYGADAMSGN